ncbi:MAG: RibD family protein, partial [Candidatus Heimdallarchaeota archaeon]|nr:RibD family protein [Candidatus Heimdallarchaeota archaeon]MCK4252841.1 RibD family protein [Candidatus Heimdallarchaeota archaeon]
MGKPEVIINVASSLDGIIGSEEGALSLSTKEDWIRVHKLRNSVDAILIGINTVISDNPLLTVRYTDPKSPHPFRVVLDSKCRIHLDSKIIQDQHMFPTIVFTSHQSSEVKRSKLQRLGVKVELIEEKDDRNFLDMKTVLKVLKMKYFVSRVLVEGGSTMITQLLKSQLVDVLHIFYRFVFVGNKGGKNLYDDLLVQDIQDALMFKAAEITKLDEGILVTLTLIKNIDNE